jgi:EAL domain-containing protein (putative c-di-GMP-specific phosphodiesterase class I)
MLNCADLTAAVGEAIDPMRLMQRVTDRTLELIAAANGVMIGLADDHGVTYVCGAGHQISHLGTRVELDSSLSGLAVRTGEIQRSDDTEADPRVDAAACRQLSVASLVCIPLSRLNQTLGVLAVNATQANAFTDDDVATLTQLADFVSVAIGSACDLSRVSTQLLELSQPSDTSSANASAGSASRYIASVLSPDTVTRIDSCQRIQRVLDDPAVLAMVFQPIVDLVTDEVAAVEALARFDVSPYRSPDLWFNEAHQIDLGVELELLAIRRALAQLPMLPHNVDLTINAGPQSVLCDQFLDTFVDVPARRVILELTEHALVDDYPQLIAVLRALRRKGTRISIDDTGSGYSSLAHILKLAPDFIKLDRELVSGIDLDPVRRALAAALVTFAADTGAQIIAEGVETEDELAVVRRLGIRYAQGYHLAHPATIDSLADTSRRRPTSPRVLHNVS